jgi:hypothetical protein
MCKDADISEIGIRSNIKFVGTPIQPHIELQLAARILPQRWGCCQAS